MQNFISDNYSLARERKIKREKYKIAMRCILQDRHLR